MKRHTVRWAVLAAGLLPIAGMQSGCGKDGGSGRSAKQARAMSASEMARMMSDPSKRAEVAYELGRRRDKNAVEVLRGVVKDTKDVETRVACLWALGEIGDVGAVVSVKFYVTDPSPAVRKAAVAALAKMPCPDAMHAIHEAYEDKDPQVRLAAVKALAVLPPEDGTPGLLAALGDPDGTVWQGAIEALAGAGAPAIKELEKAKAYGSAEKGTQSRTCMGIIKALSKNRAPEGGAVLVRVLTLACGDDRRKPIVEVRKAAIDALAGLGAAAVEAMAPVIDSHRDLAAKEAAAEVFRRIDKPAVVVKAVAKRITDWDIFPNPNELKIWVQLLGDLGDPAALPALKKAENQPGAGVKEAVAEAIRKIEAKPASPAAPPAKS